MRAKHVVNTKEDAEAIDRFVAEAGTLGFVREQWSKSYQSWSRGGNAWGQSQQGGTGIMYMLMWYQHVYRPGSNEWRPSVILRAVLDRGRELVGKQTVAP